MTYHLTYFDHALALMLHRTFDRDMDRDRFISRLQSMDLDWATMWDDHTPGHTGDGIDINLPRAGFLS